MCVFSLQIDVSGPRSYSGSSGGPMCFRCDVNVRPSGADFVHRRVGFKRFSSKSEASSASFVHRHVGFKGLFESWSHFCAQARGF